MKGRAAGAEAGALPGDISEICGGLRGENKEQKKSKVLIVGDDADVRELLAIVLGDYYDITQAESGAALQKGFADVQPDAIVLDQKDANVLVLLPIIKKQWPDTEVIVLLGQGTMEIAMEAGRHGAYNCLLKPFENGKLLADMKCAIERKEQNAPQGPIC